MLILKQYVMHCLRQNCLVLQDAAQNKAEGDPIPQGTDPEKSKGVEDAEDEKSSNRSFVLQSYTDNQTSIVSHKKFMSSAGSSTISSVANTSVLMSDSSTGSPKSFSQTPALYRETWLVQEFCDLGCLSDSLQTGLFMNTREGRPHMVGSAVGKIGGRLKSLLTVCRGNHEKFLTGHGFHSYSGCGTYLWVSCCWVAP